VSPPTSREREVAIEAVRSAARLTRSVRASFTPDLATAKPDRSPVTVADLGAQALVSLALNEAFPADPLVGEEDATQLASNPHPVALEAHLADARPGLDLPTVVSAL